VAPGSRSQIWASLGPVSSTPFILVKKELLLLLLVRTRRTAKSMVVFQILSVPSMEVVGWVEGLREKVGAGWEEKVVVEWVRGGGRG